MFDDSPATRQTGESYIIGSENVGIQYLWKRLDGQALIYILTPSTLFRPPKTILTHSAEMWL
jgi:hypothetical protein